MVSKTAKSYENLMLDEDLKWASAMNKILDRNKALEAALRDCIEWMDMREKVCPGVERVTDRAKTALNGGPLPGAD